MPQLKVMKATSMKPKLECVVESMTDEELEQLMNAADGSLISEQTPKERVTEPERLVKYDVCFNRPNNFKPKTISFAQIDDYDFSKGFTEFLISEDYVHLYLDLDSIKNEEELNGVFDWLEEVKEIFGCYSYGGYTDNEELADNYGFRLYPQGNHYVSLHVIFYQTAISTEDLQAIMKHSDKIGFHTKGIHPSIDPNVYKLVSKRDGQTTRQLFRHVLADKIYKVGDVKNKENHGCLCEEAKPSDHIVQIRGNEPIVTQKQWSKIFTLLEENPTRKLTVKAKQTDTQNVILTEEMANLNFTTKLIEMDDDEILDLISPFEPTYASLSSIVANLLHSPIEPERLKPIIEKWYFAGEHHDQHVIERFIPQYYERVESNKWFYSIIKHLSKEKRDEWISKYKYLSIDEDAKIEIETPFNLRILRTTNYSLPGGLGVNVNQFITDLMQCVVVINSANMVFIVKDYDGIRNTNKLSFLDSKTFERLLNSIKLGFYISERKRKPVNAFMIYNEGKNKNWLMKDGMKFYDERPNIQSYFTGYDYTLLPTHDESLITPFLNHILEVIADNNQQLFDYIINWYSLILQQPAGKTESAIVITGDQGTGKNVFSNVLCELMNRYSNPNLNNIDHIVGKFNTELENMKLIVCNELTTAETNKYLNSDALKSLITDKLVIINQKNMTTRSAENVANFIMISNNFAPVKIEGGDRRYVVTRTSSKYKGNSSYFKNLCQSFNKDFYNNLFTFFMKRDISKFDPRELPQTETKKQIQDVSKSSYELFIEEHVIDFSAGFERSEAFEYYSRWAKNNGFAQCNIKTFKSNIIQFCIESQVTRDGRRPHVFKLKNEYITKFEVNDELKVEEDVEIDDVPTRDMI